MLIFTLNLIFSQSINQNIKATISHNVITTCSTRLYFHSMKPHLILLCVHFFTSCLLTQCALVYIFIFHLSGLFTLSCMHFFVVSVATVPGTRTVTPMYLFLTRGNGKTFYSIVIVRDIQPRGTDTAPVGQPEHQEKVTGRRSHIYGFLMS